MPQRKTPAKGKGVGKPVPAEKPSSAAKSRRSKLAKENDITAEEEAGIKEAWTLSRHDDIEGYEDEKEGVIRTGDVRLVLRAQGLAPKSQPEMQELIDTLDPESEGYVTYPHFLALCAIQLKSKTDETKEEEVETAFNLFVPNRGVSSGAQVIRLQDLRAVARALKEDVSDEMLRAMILEANGGQGVGFGVNMEDFKVVMTRTGVFH